MANVLTTRDIPCIKREILRMREDVTVFPDLKANQMPFAMECFGISYCDESYQMTRACAQVDVIEFVLKGSGTVESPNGTFHPSAGDTYILRANEPHKYYADSSDPWVKIWVNFQGILTASIMDAYGLRKTMLLSGVNTYDFLKRIHDVASSDTMDMDTIMDRCCMIFVEMCQYIHKQLPANVRPVQIPQNIVLLKEYLDSHLHERLTLEKCSEITYLSISQTIRSFRAAYGVTPYEYLNQRRIRTARLLLRNTSLSIQDIAERTGFQDQNYFSKYFKKKCGESPSKFRNRQ